MSLKDFITRRKKKFSDALSVASTAGTSSSSGTPSPISRETCGGNMSDEKEATMVGRGASRQPTVSLSPEDLERGNKKSYSRAKSHFSDDGHESDEARSTQHESQDHLGFLKATPCRQPAARPSPFTPASSQSSNNVAICPICGKGCKRLMTRASNRNGNGGRPYDKCIPCDKFVRFVDDRGVAANNPQCYCEEPSKRLITSREKGRRMFYVCQQTRSCDFYQEHLRRDGTPFSVDDDLVDLLRRHDII